MSIEQEPFGVTPEGEPITRFVLTNRHGLSVTLISLGATLTSVRTPDRHGRFDEINLGYDSLDAYLTNRPFFGATVGRYANRIANARFVLDDFEYVLHANDGPHTLHGGPRGFHRVVWDPRIEEVAEGPQIHFSYTSVDGEEKFPGNLEVKVSYTLSPDNRLRIDYFAETDQPTPVNLTNHAYWNLGEAGKGDVLDHFLWIRGEKYVAVDDTLIPTGDLPPVEGTPLDFRRPTRIGQRIGQLGQGYDRCYVLNRHDGVLEKVAEVHDPMSGRVLTVETTQPGMQLYTGNYLEREHGAGGRVFRRHAGLCLETQHFPDSPNQPHFPGTILRPGGTYRHSTVYAFSAR